MKNFPKITVVTPSFNQGQFLRETIESVLGQSYSNLEYFIIDGGSTDNSLDIIREYDGDIDWWVSEEDGGQSEAINKGFERANGELLCWVNSDDVLFPDCLKEVADHYVKNNRPDLIHAYGVYTDENGVITRLDRVPKQLHFFMNRGIWSSPAPAVFFRASSLRRVGYLNTRYRLSMDLDIWMKMMKAGGRVGHVRKYLGAFRWHSTSLTSRAMASKKSMNDENPETKSILHTALPKSTESRRRLWRMLRRLYRTVKLDYLIAYLETRKVKGQHWKDVFGNAEEKSC